MRAPCWKPLFQGVQDGANTGSQAVQAADQKERQTYPSRTWWIRYWQDGRHVRESTGTANERVARKIAAEKQAELDAGGKAIVDVGWDRAVKEFLDYKAAVCREATAPAYGWSLTAFQKLMAPKAQTYRRVGAAGLRGGTARHDAAATTNKDLRGLRSFLYFAKSKHYIGDVPKFPRSLDS